jgi:hypothetical protein
MSTRSQPVWQAFWGDMLIGQDFVPDVDFAQRTLDNLTSGTFRDIVSCRLIPNAAA